MTKQKRSAVLCCKFSHSAQQKNSKFLVLGWKNVPLIDYALAKTLDFIIKML